jgi:starch synthase (maltosyl-transferring)
MSPSWGVYSGFELFEHVPVREGSEEYLDSEKYQLRPRDFAAAQAEGRSLAPLLSTLNRIRAEHPALQQLREVSIQYADSDELLTFVKQDPTTGEIIIVVCTLNPAEPIESMVHLDVTALGLASTFTVVDLLTGSRFEWGEHNYVRLDPAHQPAHILHVEAVS